MSNWIQGGYDGLFYLGEQGTDDYSGYVVRTSDDASPEVWFAYVYRGGFHKWLGEGSKELAMQALERVSQCL